MNQHNTVSGSKYGGSAATYETSSRQSRYSSSRAEERVTSTTNGGVNQSAISSISSYSITGGVAATGKPVLRKTCKGVTIERKFKQ